MAASNRGKLRRQAYHLALAASFAQAQRVEGFNAPE
jgi:hypothetical protein